MDRVSRNIGRRRSRLSPRRLLFPKIRQNCFRLECPCNFRSQFLQTNSVTACQYYSPGIGLDVISKSEHGRGLCKRLSKRCSRRLNDLTRIVTSFSDSPRDFREFRFTNSAHRRHQTHQMFSPSPPLSPVAPAAFVFLSGG
jgi:hypothetical protein